eukprot:scaffold17428_cov26-Tisochrysis_lutea.AAC.3
MLLSCCAVPHVTCSPRKLVFPSLLVLWMTKWGNEWRAWMARSMMLTCVLLLVPHGQDKGRLAKQKELLPIHQHALCLSPFL